MLECDVCGLMFAGGDACPSCGSRIHHIAAEDVDDGKVGRQQGPLPGESALSDAIEGLSGVDLSAPKSPSLASNLPFQVGGKGMHAANLPFGIGAPNRVIVDSGTDPTESLQPSVPIATPELESNVVELEAESVSEEQHLMVDEAPVLLLDARPMESSFEEEQLSDFPVLVEDAYQINAAAFDTSQVYAVEDDVVIHDFGDELQVSEVIVNFDDLVDPAEQTVHFDPELLTEGEPELLPARALPIDDDGNPEVASLVASGFHSLGESRWSDAADRFREVCNALPGNSEALNDFGLALLQQAIVIHESNPTSAPAEEPHFEAAVLALRQAAQQNKHNPTIMYNLATCLASCGRHGVATRIWDAAIALAPNDSAAVNGKAVSLIALGEFDSATTLLSRAREMSPADALIVRNLKRLRPTT